MDYAPSGEVFVMQKQTAASRQEYTRGLGSSSFLHLRSISVQFPSVVSVSSRDRPLLTKLLMHLLLRAIVCCLLVISYCITTWLTLCFLDVKKSCMRIHVTTNLVCCFIVQEIFIPATRLTSNLRPRTPGSACIYLRVVTSGHVTKMATTSFDPPYLKTPCCMQTLRICVL